MSDATTGPVSEPSYTPAQLAELLVDLRDVRASGAANESYFGGAADALWGGLVLAVVLLLGVIWHWRPGRSARLALARLQAAAVQGKADAAWLNEADRLLRGAAGEEARGLSGPAWCDYLAERVGRDADARRWRGEAGACLTQRRFQSVVGLSAAEAAALLDLLRRTVGDLAAANKHRRIRRGG